MAGIQTPKRKENAEFRWRKKVRTARTTSSSSISSISSSSFRALTCIWIMYLYMYIPSQWFARKGSGLAGVIMHTEPKSDNNQQGRITRCYNKGIK